MVPRAQPQPGQGAREVGDNVEDVEGAAVGEHGLHKLGANTEPRDAHYQRQVCSATARRVDNPVEDDGEDQKGEKMQRLVIDWEACRPVEVLL